MHVVIVGAGPCGLSLALALAQAGIQITVVERGNTIDTRPRAVHLTAPGIQIFKKAGVFEDVRDQGFVPKDWAYRRFDGSCIVKVEDVANSKSPEATIVLPIGMLNKLLLFHAEKNPRISLKWNTRVMSVGQDEKRAWAIVKDDAGKEHKFSGDYVCGCDGGTSQVRKSLLGEKNFPGKTWGVQMVATDVWYPFDEYGYDDVNTVTHPTDGHMVARLTTSGLWRVAYQEDINMSYDDVLANHPAHYERMLPGHPKPDSYTVTNINPYRLHQRCAERFCVGRIALAGDAAHLCNPWGGLGLTTGFADVVGLADCLLGIEKGLVDEKILDKYDEIRRDIFHNVVDPVSTGNFLKVSSLGEEGAIEKDPFVAMCRTAMTDPEIKGKMYQAVYAICHDFTQYYDKTI